MWDLFFEVCSLCCRVKCCAICMIPFDRARVSCFASVLYGVYECTDPPRQMITAGWGLSAHSLSDLSVEDLSVDDISVDDLSDLSVDGQSDLSVDDISVDDLYDLSVDDMSYLSVDDISDLFVDHVSDVSRGVRFNRQGSPPSSGGRNNGKASANAGLNGHLSTRHVGHVAYKYIR